MQDFVNDGHQPWRQDAEPVAAEELLKYEADSFASVSTAHPETVTLSDRAATFRWSSDDKSRTYTIELLRPSWLLRRAKRYEWMVWFPVKTTIKTCKVANAQKQ